MKRMDAVPSTDESYLSLDTHPATRASVLTLDGRASVITKGMSSFFRSAMTSSIGFVCM